MSDQECKDGRSPAERVALNGTRQNKSSLADVIAACNTEKSTSNQQNPSSTSNTNTSGEISYSMSRWLDQKANEEPWRPRQG